MVENPFSGIPKANVQADIKRERRALSEKELRRLFRATRIRPLVEAKTVRRGPNKGEQAAKVRPKTEVRLQRLGRERELIYRTLAFTGLRQNELASITVAQVHTSANPPYIDLNAADEKSGRGTKIPLRRDLAVLLTAWIDEKPHSQPVLSMANAGRVDPSTKLFNVPAQLVKILDRDLIAAGIPKRDDRGRTIDVHALRHSFGTMLAKSGATPKESQLAMRHSKIELTMNTYVDASLVDVVGAVESLPTIADHQTLMATGTGEARKNCRREAPNRAPAHANSGKREQTGEDSPISSTGSRHEKTSREQSVSRGFPSEADGTRTRNHRIDSPVL